MNIPRQQAPWLFFMFRLPARRASRRVSAWRKLQHWGTLGWRNSAYILPHSPENLERLQWLTREVRKWSGEASVVLAEKIEGVSDRELRDLFNARRDKDYIHLQHLLRSALSRKRPGPTRASVARLQHRLEHVISIDYFGCGRRKDAEALLAQMEERLRSQEGDVEPRRGPRTGYQGRTWMTRPRPEIDRVASAWLIRNFIDPQASFVFAVEKQAHPEAIAFDMYEGEFTHEGDHCTFEVLVRRFRLKDKGLQWIAAMVHDNDLEDDKFQRPEGAALQRVFQGWGRLNWADEEIVRQGALLLDGLYESLKPIARRPK